MKGTDLAGNRPRGHSVPPPFRDSRVAVYLVLLALAGTFLLLLPIYLFPEDGAGWGLFYANFFIVLAFRDFRRDLSLTASVWLVLAVHQAVSITNAFHHTVIGADKDAHRFYVKAVLYIQEGVTDWQFFSDAGQTYSQFLANAFRLTGGPSLFLGEQLSILALTLSFVTLAAVARLLFIEKRVGRLIVLFGLIPSSIIYCSITLREAWQVLFTLLMTYGALRLRERPGPGPIFMMALIAAILGVMHHGLALFAILTMILSVVWAYRSRARKPAFLRKVLVGMLVTAVLLVALNRDQPYLHALGALQSGRVLEFVDDFRMRTFELDARTNYGVFLDTSSIFSMFVTLIPVVVNYMFAPFPWQIATPQDVVAFLESALRLLLLVFAVKALWRCRGERRKRLAFVLVVFCFAELLWALGTVNWGTAIRHHLTAYGLLVLAGGPLLLDDLRGLGISFLRVPTPGIRGHSAG